MGKRVEAPRFTRALPEAVQIGLRAQAQLAAWRAAGNGGHDVVAYDAETQARHQLLVADYVDAIDQEATRKLWRGVVSRSAFRRARASRCVPATSRIGVRSRAIAARVARARSPRSPRRGRAARPPGGSDSGSDPDPEPDSSVSAETYLAVTGRSGMPEWFRDDAIDRDPTPNVLIERGGELRPNEALSIVADGLRHADARARRLVTLSWSGSSVYMLAADWKILISVRGVLVHAAVIADVFGARHVAIHRVGTNGVPIHDGIRFVGWVARLITAPALERVAEFNEFVNGRTS